MELMDFEKSRSFRNLDLLSQCAAYLPKFVTLINEYKHCPSDRARADIEKLYKCESLEIEINKVRREFSENNCEKYLYKFVECENVIKSLKNFEKYLSSELGKENDRVLQLIFLMNEIDVCWRKIIDNTQKNISNSISFIERY
ncbi:MAG: hypothetical protein QW409_03405 [Candidatus Aenigmatarchaeota archaeon]